MLVGIEVEHLIAHVHTQNGLAEAFIKRLQLIARPLLMRTKLPIYAWGHAILHAAALVRIRQTANHKQSPFQLVLGQIPNLSHLRVFGCTIQVPIAPPQRTKMGPQRRSGIYISFDSLSIIKYLKPLTGDVFRARFADCHFDEVNFLSLGGDKLPKEERREIIWNASSMSHLDPRTTQCDKEVQRITHLQKITSQLPDAFTNTAKVTKSYIPAANTPARINIPIGKTAIMAANESSMTRLKRGRPLGSKDLIPRKRKIKGQQNPNIEENSTPKEATPIVSKIITPEKESAIEVTHAPEEAIVPEEIQNHEDAQVLANDEIFLNYASIGELWDRTKVVINEVFCFAVAT